MSQTGLRFIEVTSFVSPKWVPQMADAAEVLAEISRAPRVVGRMAGRNSVLRLLAGGMLAFALSFDEVIVTTFTAGQQNTLPIWMLEELIRPRQRPVTNVVAMVVFAATFFPILAAYYLTRGGGETARGGK